MDSKTTLYLHDNKLLSLVKTHTLLLDLTGRRVHMNVNYARQFQVNFGAQHQTYNNMDPLQTTFKTHFIETSNIY